MALSEKELRKAVALDAGDPLTHYYLGILLFKQSRLEEAAKALRQCLKLSPDLPSAHLNLGLVLMRMGKRAEGRRHLERFRFITSIATNDHQKRIRVSSRLLAARADLGAGRLDSALALTLEARAIAPKDPTVHRFLAIIYKRQGRLAEGKQAQALADRLTRAGKKQ